jgi:hypothetical protein
MLGIGLHQESVELDEEDLTDAGMRIVRAWREVNRGPAQMRAIDQEDSTILSARSCWQTIHTKDRAEILYSNTTAHSEHIPESSPFQSQSPSSTVCSPRFCPSSNPSIVHGLYTCPGGVFVF